MRTSRVVSASFRIDSFEAVLNYATMKIDRRSFIAASSSAVAFAKSDLRFSGPPQPSPQRRQVTVYTTAENTNHRLSPTGTVSFKPLAQPLETQICVFVDPAKQFQTILGVGGALTDASAETFAKLPRAKQQELLNAYFDRRSGIAYTLARTNIHSCDFSSASYTYVDEGDNELRSFSVQHDR